MSQLIHAGLDKTAREATMKEGLGVAVDVILSVRNIISSEIQAIPQAALAWTGVCLTLEVRLSVRATFRMLTSVVACQPRKGDRSQP